MKEPSVREFIGSGGSMAIATVLFIFANAAGVCGMTVSIARIWTPLEIGTLLEVLREPVKNKTSQLCFTTGGLSPTKILYSFFRITSMTNAFRYSAPLRVLHLVSVQDPRNVSNCETFSVLGFLRKNVSFQGFRQETHFKPSARMHFQSKEIMHF